MNNTNLRAIRYCQHMDTHSAKMLAFWVADRKLALMGDVGAEPNRWPNMGSRSKTGAAILAVILMGAILVVGLQGWSPGEIGAEAELGRIRSECQAKTGSAASQSEQRCEAGQMEKSLND
jgi:hypothetical protein